MATQKLHEDISQWDRSRLLGQILLCGFDGTECNNQIKTLITDFHIGAIFLAQKNLRPAAQATKLCLDLQSVARAAGHTFPLLIAADQENGGLNSLSDPSLIHEFPSNLGLAAVSSRSVTQQVAKATAHELKSVGINLLLGPVLNVMADAQSQALCPRSFGESPEEVSAFGNEYIKGCKDAGLSCCVKYFPFFAKPEHLRTASGSRWLAPFRDAIKHGIDAILVGDVAVDLVNVSAMHACLSERVVDGLLRNDLRFRGVVVSDFLELSMSRDVDIQGAAVMSVQAGCDLIMVCRPMALQTQALQGLELGLDGATLEFSKVYASVLRITEWKSRCTSWEAALNPPGTRVLGSLRIFHKELSRSAYSQSITAVRDSKRQLPVTKRMTKGQPGYESMRGSTAGWPILLLTPLITPLPSSRYHSPGDAATVMKNSELVFQRFGAILGTHSSTKVVHTSYSAYGVRPRHEELIRQARKVVIITADVKRNMYQRAFAKQIALLCNQNSDKSSAKTCAVVAVASPYDFAIDALIDPYICTYDYTETALKSLARILYGEVGILYRDIQAKGAFLKGKVPAHTQVFGQQWLVEKADFQRDSVSLANLLIALRSEPETASFGIDHVSAESLMRGHDEIQTHHLVIRNPSERRATHTGALTKELFGFCAVYHIKESTSGYIGLLVVDPRQRNQSIGRTLQARAIHVLQHTPGVATIHLGLPTLMTLPGVPISPHRTHEWLSHRGWNFNGSERQSRITADDLQLWKAPEGLSRSLSSKLSDVKFDIVQARQEHASGIFDHVKLTSSSSFEMLYKLLLFEGVPIMRAKSLQDGTTIGTGEYHSFSESFSCSTNGSPELMPCSRTILVCAKRPGPTRGMSALDGLLIGPAVSHEHEFRDVILQSLILLGLKHLKKHGAETFLLEAGTTSPFRWLKEWGFASLQLFEYDTAMRLVEPT